MEKQHSLCLKVLRRLKEAGLLNEAYYDHFYSLKVHYYNFMGWKYWQCREVLNGTALPDNEI